MSYVVDDTIAAIASAPGGAVRGVIRLSGPRTIACLQSCFQPRASDDLGQLAYPTVIPGDLELEPQGGTLPCDLYLWPTTRSYTRQVSAELHTLGAPPLLNAALQVLCQCGVRLAEPGEFTLRAFLAGRLDLTQAEAVLGVVDAEDTRTLDIALTQLAGGLSGPLGALRSDLLDLLADLEAGLDFVDEDIAFVSHTDAMNRLRAAHERVEQVLAQITSRATGARLPRVVLHGRPNVGKSSLVNALCQGHVAIVSELAGTTRDYVSRQFCWDGICGVLIDTAGVEELDLAGNDEGNGTLDSAVPLANQAQQMAQSQREHADIELLCLDATRPLNAWECSVLRQTQCAARAQRLVIWTKTDSGKTDSGDVSAVSDHRPILTSSHTGVGIPALRKRICELLTSTAAPATLVVASTAQRCRFSLEAAAEHVDRACQLIAQDEGHELVALELRDALEQLGQVVGAVYTDDILDRVFQRFCIGK